MTKNNRDVVVIGASAGGVSAISRLTAALPPELEASLMIVVHVSPRASNAFHRTLCGKSKLTCISAKHGDRLEHGRAFVAPPDRHMRVIGSDSDLRVQLDRGPRESRSRPSIDALFRSAAGACGPRTIGVLLTGYLDDGVTGLAAIQRCGGRVLVQDASDAEVPDLPRRALQSLKVDRAVPLADMADAIVELVGERIEPGAIISEDAATEAAIAARSGDLWPELERIGDRSSLGCPSCGGPLWAVDPGRSGEHFRCHVGHAFSPLSLLDDQDQEIERALLSAIRVMEEKTRFLMRFAETSPSSTGAQNRFREEALATKAEAQTLREFLVAQRSKP